LLSYNNTFTSGGTNYTRKIAEAGTKYIKQSITPTTTGGNVLSVDQGTFRIVQRRADLNEITATQSFATDYEGFKTMFADTSFTDTVAAASAITGVAFTVSAGAVTVTVIGAVTSQQIYNYWKYWSSLAAQMGIDQQLIRLISGDLKITGSLTTSAVITSAATAPTITATGTVSITGAGAITGTFTDSTGTRVSIRERTDKLLSTYVTINGTPVGGTVVDGTLRAGWVPMAAARVITVQPADAVRIAASYYGSKPTVFNLLGSEIDKFTLALDLEPAIDTTTNATIRDAITASFSTIVNGATLEVTTNRTLKEYTPKQVLAGLDYYMVSRGYLLHGAIAANNNASLYAMSEGTLVTYSPNYKIRMADLDSSGNAIVPSTVGYEVPLVVYYQDLSTGVKSTMTLLNASGAFLGTAPWTQLQASIGDADQASIAAKVDASTVLAKEATVSSRASQASVNAIPTNPLLTTDARLNNLDATISSRSTLTAGQLAGVAVDVQTMNGAEVIGDGTAGNPWRGVGVAP
jgi:hypothetical protein